MIEATSHIELHRVKRLMKNLAKASRKIEERSAARQDLNSQVKRVRKFAVDRRIKDDTLDKEIRVLNEKIGEVLSKESELLNIEKHDAMGLARLNSKITQLESRIGSIDVPKLVNELFKVESLLSSDRDVHSLEVLKEKVDEIEKKISGVSSQDVKTAISRVSDKIENLITVKSEREKRIEELEEQIKNKVELETSEIKKLDDQIAHLEEKLLHAKISGMHAPHKIEAVEHKINQLKLKSVEAKLKKHKVDLSQLDKAIEAKDAEMIHSALRQDTEKPIYTETPVKEEDIFSRKIQQPPPPPAFILQKPQIKKEAQGSQGPSRVDVSHLIEDKPRLDLGTSTEPLPPPPPPILAGAPRRRGLMDKVKHILG